MNITQDIVPSDMKITYPGLSISVVTTVAENLPVDDNGVPYIAPPLSFGMSYLPGTDTNAKNAWIIQVHLGGTNYAFYLIPLSGIVPSVAGNLSLTYSFTGSPVLLSASDASIRNISSDVTQLGVSGTSAYQTIRFFDGTAFGELRIFPDHVSLVLSEGNPLDFDINATFPHQYRITGKGQDVKVYIDGQLAIDASGGFVSSTLNRELDFGATTDCNSASVAAWDYFKYTTKGALSPNYSEETSLSEIVSFPNKQISVMKEYNSELYMSVDSKDQTESSELYKYTDGAPVFEPEVEPLTQSAISSVIVDQSRNGTVFGTSGKFVGTDNGLQYIIGSKVFPFDVATSLSTLPSSDVWSLEENCSENCATVVGSALKLDTSSEVGLNDWKYVQSNPDLDWPKAAKNQTGWTVEVVVKIENDGSGGTVNAVVSNLVSSNCSAIGTDSAQNDSLEAPGIYVNDGKFQETIQFFQNGIRLKSAKIFATQVLSDQFYTIRVIGRLNGIAVFAKGENESSFKRLIFDTNAFSSPVSSPGSMERAHACVDDVGITHVVWQQIETDVYGVYYSRFQKTKIANGSLVGSGSNTIVAAASDFVSSGVTQGDELIINGSVRYVISRVSGRTSLVLETTDDFSALPASTFIVVSKQREWTPSQFISSKGFDCTDPRIAFLNGSLFVAYGSAEHGHSEVFSRIGVLSQQGTAWGQTLRVTNSSRDSRRPDIAATADGKIAVVFESAGTDGNEIKSAKIEPSQFGFSAPVINSVASGSGDFRNPKLGIISDRYFVVYESDGNVTDDFKIVAVNVSSALTPVSTFVFETEGVGSSPSIIGFLDNDGNKCHALAWHQQIGAKSDVYFSFSSEKNNSGGYPVWINPVDSTHPKYVATNSSGNSKNATLSRLGNFVFVTFESDRSRSGVFEPYYFRAQVGSSTVGDDNTSSGDFDYFDAIKEIASSRFGSTDIHVLTDSTETHNIFSVADVSDMSMFWETNTEGVSSIVGLSSDMVDNSNHNIVGYFPLNDLTDGTPGVSPTKHIFNTVRTIGEDGNFLNRQFGTISLARDVMSVASPFINASLYAQAEEQALDLSDSTKFFNIPAALINDSGAIDMRLRPHFSSSDLGKKVFFGNGSNGIDVTDVNSMCCGIGPETSGTSLRFRIVDSTGVIHETKILGNPLTLWAAEEDVHIRAVWDKNAIGVSRINDVWFNPDSASIGLACGNQGSIFRTTDGGVTWTKIKSDVTYDLYSICFAGNNGCACGEMGTLLFSTDHGLTWTLAQTTDGTDPISLTEDLKGIALGIHPDTDIAVNAIVGYAAGTNGAILFTSDGGATWVLDGISGVSSDFNCVGMSSNSAGDGECFVVAGNGGALWSKASNASSWVESSQSATIDWLSASRTYSSDPSPIDRLLVAGTGFNIVGSTNNGATWINVSPSFPTASVPSITAIARGGNNSGHIAFYAGGKIGYSTDSGATWSFVDTRGETVSCLSLDGIGRIIASGQAGFLMRSVDQGANQVYGTILSKNLTLIVNGKELDQQRTNDAPFSWVPQLLTFGSSTFSAQTVIDDLVIYASPPPRESSIARQEIRSLKSVALSVYGMEGAQKRIEWGNISPYAKGTTYWKQVKMFFCGSKEPVQTYCWNTDVGLSDNVVNDLAVDENGLLWAATDNGITSFSISKLNDCIDRWQSGLPQVSDSSLVTTYTGLPVSGRIITVAASALGVFASTETTSIQLDRPAPLENIDPASQANIVSPLKADPGTFVILGTAPDIVTLIFATDNAVYFGTRAGLYVLEVDDNGNIANFEYTVGDGLPSNWIKDVDADSDGNVWVATNMGLAKIASTVSAFDSRSGLVGSDVSSVFVDGDGRKVLGTNFGLAILEGSEFSIYPPASGIGSSILVAGDFDSSGSYWFASSAGLLEFNRSCNKATLMSVADGIIGNENVVDYQRYRIVGIDLTGFGCNKPFAFVSVNGTVLDGGYSVDYDNSWVNLDRPLTASDNVRVSINSGLVKIDGALAQGASAIKTTKSSYSLYRKSFPAGTVSFGGASALGVSGDSIRNFSVIVVPISGSVFISVSKPTASITPLVIGGNFYSDLMDKVVSFPSEVSGAKRIILANADSAEISDDYLDFSISTACLVYVAFDSRAATLPNWLREFDKVSVVTKISAMKAFVDGSGKNQLFIGTKGSNGCVYSLLDEPATCDISAKIALDALPPNGCAKVASVDSNSAFTLSLSATDAVTGVADMQVSANADFTEPDGSDTPWIPFQSTYSFEFPPESVSTTSTAVTIDSGNGTCMIVYNGTIMVGTSNPGLIYKYTPATESLALLVDTGEQEVHCLAVFNGKLIIGTGINGKTFSWDSVNGLVQFPASVGTRITALGTYNGNLYVGAYPTGEIWIATTEGIDGTFQLFKNTQETAITGFATFGALLYWSSEDEGVSEGDVLSTTVTNGHKHNFTVGANGLLVDLNGFTTVADDHSHQVLNGVIQPANGHTHLLNGSGAGKVFSYDGGTQQVRIVHADTDHSVSSLGSTATDLFAGTYPHGKILRNQSDVFIKSFQTPNHYVRKLALLSDATFVALVDDDIYSFSKVWTYKASVDGTANDVLADSSVGNVIILQDSTLAKTVGSPASAQQLCAYVRFRDVAGNITSPKNSSGQFDTCYNPCASTVPVTTPGGTVVGANRLFEIDSTGKVVLSLSGNSAFYSGSKVEEEVGVYYSEVFNGTSSLVQWNTVGWDASVPTGTEATIAVRTADTSASLQYALFTKEFTIPEPNDISSLQGQFLQFRATIRSTKANTVSPSLNSVSIKLRTSQATHFYTTNFRLPDQTRTAILTYNGCINPPSTDLIFGISGQDSTDFGDYYVIPTNKAFEIPAEHQTTNLRVGIKFISSPSEVPVVDEFALLFSLANDALVKLNLPGAPTEVKSQISTLASTRTVTTDKVQGHVHSVTFDSSIADKGAVNVRTSINAGHYHDIVNGVVQVSAGHTHDFEI